MFANVEAKAAMSLMDVDSIYRIPLEIHRQELDDVLVHELCLDCDQADPHEWQQVIVDERNPSGEVTIALVGKHVNLTDSYKSLSEAITHAGIHTHTRVNVLCVEAEALEKEGTDVSQQTDGIIIPGGFGNCGVEGMILAVEYTRRHQVPFLGICLGMQVASIKFARDKVGLTNANSTEFAANTLCPVVGFVAEWMDANGQRETRNENSDLGGAMRLGGQKCLLAPNSRVRQLHGAETIVERHQSLPQLEAAGPKIAGRSADEKLVEIIELEDHPWFVGCQFHPEFTSTPRHGHSLFNGFVQAVRQHGKSTGFTFINPVFLVSSSSLV